MKGLVAHRAEQDGRAKGLCLRDDGRIIWRQDFSARNMTQPRLAPPSVYLLPTHPHLQQEAQPTFRRRGAAFCAG